jgi:TP901 family phage tail tape measure protein
MSVIVGELVATITADVSGFRRDIQNIQNQGNNFTDGFSNSTNRMGQNFGNTISEMGNRLQAIGGTFENIGSSIKNLGGNLTKYITLPLAGVSTGVFLLGKDFEAELSKVVGLVGVAKGQVDEWGKEILTLAPELGRAPKELAEALFFVTSAGLRGAEAMDVLKSSAKASSAGLGDTAVIADLVTSAMNAYGAENLSASKATDILVSAVREGKAEASALAGSMGQVLPLASEMGVTFDQVASAQAAMTRTGTSADEAATQLKAILSGLIKPADNAEKALDAMGTSSAKLRKQIREEGLIATLKDLKDMTNKYGEDAMARVFPNIRGLMGVLDLMGASAETNIEIFDRVKNSTGMLEEAFASASETLDFKWNQALSKIQATALGFFDLLKGVMLPVLDALIVVLDFVSQKFNGLSEPVQKAMLVFAGIMGILGPVVAIVGGLVTALGIGISGVGAIITTLGTIITTIGLPALAGLVVAIPVLIAGIMGIIAVIGVWVGSLIYLWKNNEDFRKQVISTWETIKTNAIIIFNDIKLTIQHVIGIIKKIWQEHGDEIKRISQMAWDVILTGIKIATTIIKNIIQVFSAVIRGDWKALFVVLSNLIGNAVSGWAILFEKLKNLGVKAIQLLAKLVIEAISGLIRRLRGYGEELSQFVGSLIAILLGKFKGTDFYNAGTKIIKEVIRGVKSMLGELGKVASQMASTIRNKLPFSPAKEGPLKDLDKLNFAGSINKSLIRARREIKIPTIKLGQEVMNNLLDEKRLNVKGTNNNGISINGPLSINGVTDLYSMMQEIKNITRRFTGRV